MIQIEEILEPSRVLTGLAGANKTEVLQMMVNRLSGMGMVSQPDRVIQNLLERERLMTTGVKRGFAFPHTFSPQFDFSFLSLGTVPGGVDYESLDGNPAEFIFLLLGPPHHQTLHLRVLARISRLTGQPQMLERLRAAQTAEAIMQLLGDAEAQLQPYAPGAMGLF